MNRVTVLHTTSDVSVRRFDHPPDVAHDDPDLEVADAWNIAFVRDGSFSMRVNGAARRLARGSVILKRPGLEFQCWHHEQCPSDLCVSITFSESSVSGLEWAWARPGWEARETATPRLAYVDRRLAMVAAGADTFEMERWALGALVALEEDAGSAASRGPYAPCASDVDAIVEACRAIEAVPDARRSIADRAREVGLTSTRLTLAFRRYVGVSPHQFVVRCRLLKAAELLCSGVSVTETCYRSGFENLSHFCRTFHRTFGMRPSQWRGLPRREIQRKVQAIRQPRP